jgi:branched-chain amino acid transport system substrate-binding protein
MRKPQRTPRAAYAAASGVLVALACAGGLLIGCKQTSTGPDIGRLPELTSDDPQAEAEVREANELLAQGKSGAAARRYRAFLRARPDDKLVPLVQLSLGKILLSQAKDGEALALFQSVAGHPEPAVAEQGRFYAAVANHRLGRHAEAIDAMAPMVGRTIEPADTLLLLTTLAGAYQAEARFFDAIATLERLQREPLPQASRESARRTIIDLVATKATPADIRAGIERLDPKGFAFSYVLTRAVKDAHAANDLDRTRELLELVEEHGIPPDPELAAIKLSAAAPSDANPAAIGAILPLSGRARRVGEQALRGLMLAAGLPIEGPRPPSAPTVVFRDDGGDAARAVQAVHELVTVHRVIAIIGPLDAQVAMAAGARAQELGVPLIALTPAASPASIGPMVFRYFPTPRSEARALAAAIRARGAETVAVLHPQSAYGETMRSTFLEEARALGLRPGPTQAYPSGSTAFGTQAAALAKEPFDALFVPDAAQPLALIAPALAAAGLWTSERESRPGQKERSIVLAAPSVAFDASLPKLAGRYLQTALFAVPFDPQSQVAPVPDFVARFQQAFGSMPDVFAAFAHDAFRLTRATVDAGALTRELVATRLPATRDPELVAGGSGFSERREAAAPTHVVELRGDAFTAVSD